MNKLFALLPLLLLAGNLFGVTAFTEFYSGLGGTNINSGSTTNTTATYTSTNGLWSTVTSVFTPVDGSTPASTVSAGMWASLYIDDATLGVYIARITNVVAGVNGAISIDPLTGAGTAPTTSVTLRSIKVGGCWFGPLAAIDWPFDLANSLRLTNSSYDRPRLNFKNDKEYTISASIAQAANGPIRYEGMTSVPGDGGRAVVTGNGVGSAINLMTLAGNDADMGNFIFRSNGTSSAASSALTVSGSRNTIFRISFTSLRSPGIITSGTGVTITECEAFNCVQDNTAQRCGMESQNGVDVVFQRCISYSNTTANASGFGVTGSANLLNCVSAGNGTNGLVLQPTTQKINILNCDFYGNGGNGIELKGTASITSAAYIENCNFFNNSLYGISSQLANSNMVGIVRYCAFGSGTAANGSGTVLLGATRSGGLDVQDNTFITYSANTTPWLAPNTGDFRISNNQGWGVGRGSFTESGAYTGTQSFIDIGAAQHRGVTNATAAAFAQ